MGVAMLLPGAGVGDRGKSLGLNKVISEFGGAGAGPCAGPVLGSLWGSAALEGLERVQGWEWSREGAEAPGKGLENS